MGALTHKGGETSPCGIHLRLDIKKNLFVHKAIATGKDHSERSCKPHPYCAKQNSNMATLAFAFDITPVIMLCGERQAADII